MCGCKVFYILGHFVDPFRVETARVFLHRVHSSLDDSALKIIQGSFFMSCSSLCGCIRLGNYPMRTRMDFFLQPGALRHRLSRSVNSRVTLGIKAEPQNVLRGQHVSIVGDAAHPTRPRPVSQTQVIIDCAARAHLKRRHEATDLHQVLPAPLTLVRELADELRPGRIVDGARQAAHLPHALHVQRLNYPGVNLVLVRHLARQLVQEVFSAVRDLLVNMREFQPRLAPVIGALLLAAQTPVRAAQFRQGGLQEARVRYLAPVGEGRESCQSNVNANGPGLLQRLLLNDFPRQLDQDLGVVLPGRRLDNGNGADLAIEHSWVSKTNPSDAGEVEQVFREIHLDSGGILEQLPATPPLERREASLLLEKSLEGGVEVPNRGLERGESNILEPHRTSGLLETCDLLGEVNPGQALLRLLVDFDLSLKGLVVNPAGRAEVLRQILSLRVVRVEPERISLQHKKKVLVAAGSTVGVSAREPKMKMPTSSGSTISITGGCFLVRDYVS